MDDPFAEVDAFLAEAKKPKLDTRTSPTPESLGEVDRYVKERSPFQEVDDFIARAKEAGPSQAEKYQAAVKQVIDTGGGDARIDQMLRGVGISNPNVALPGIHLRPRDLPLPFQDTARAIRRGITGEKSPAQSLKVAEAAFAAGKATDDQLYQLAIQEYEQNRSQKIGAAGRIAQGVAQAPAIVAEAMVGGAAVRGLGASGQAAGGLARGLEGAVVQAAATPITPGLWLKEAEQRQAENGGALLDPQNVGAPMVKAAFQNAIMGHIGEATKGMGLLKRAGSGAVLMPAEQAGADALTSLGEKAWKAAGMDEKWATKTDFGTIGSMIKGDHGKAWEEIAVQAAMGALFAGFMGGKEKPIESLQQADKALEKYPKDSRAAIIAEAQKRPLDDIPEGKVRDYVAEVRKVAPEAPKPPPEAAKPEPAPAPVQPEIVPPAKPQGQIRPQTADPFSEYTPKGPNRPAELAPPSSRMVDDIRPEEPTPLPKKGKLAKKPVEPPKAPEPVRVSEDQTRPNVDLEDFFGKPAEAKPAEKAFVRPDNPDLDAIMNRPEPAKAPEPYGGPERRTTAGESPTGVERRKALEAAVGDRLVDVGEGMYVVEHGNRYLAVTPAGENRVSLNFDFGKETPGSTEAPPQNRSSPGTQAIFTDLGKIVAELKKTGTEIEYAASDAKSLPTALRPGGGTRSRASLYAKALQEGGYELVEKVGDKHVWKPKAEPKPSEPTPPETREVKDATEKAVLAGESVASIEESVRRGQEAADADAQKGSLRPKEAAPADRPVGAGLVGNDTLVRVPDAKPVPGRYEVRELSDLIASHGNRKGEYPKDLQPRDYKETGEKEKVSRFAREMVTDQYLSDDPNASGGPSTITENGTVLNGNGRQMSLEEAARIGTYGKYKDALVKKAGNFGVDPDSVRGMKQPVLVRVVGIDPNSPLAAEFARRGNLSTTQGQSPVRTAASLSNLVDRSVIDSLKLEGDTTFAEAVNDPRKGAAFRDRLRKELPASEVPKYFKDDGSLTEGGKELVRDMLLSKIVPVEVIEKMAEDMKAEKRTLEGAIPQLLLLGKTDLNLAAPLAEAVEVLVRNPKIQSVRDADNALAQRDMFGAAVVISPEGRMMLDFLVIDGQKPLVFRKTLGKLIADLEQSTKGLFADGSFDPVESASRILGVEKRDGAKFKGGEPEEGFGRPLSPEEKQSGQVVGASGLGDAPADPLLRETALANAKVDEGRAQHGLPPLMEPARRMNADAWDRAMIELGKDPNASANLVNDLTRKMRPVSVDEEALLLHRDISLKNQYDRTIRSANEAMLRNKDMAEFDRLSARADELLGEIDKLGKITQAVGTETGRALQFRKQLAAEDFSLGRMMNVATRNKKAPLSPDEKQEITRLHDEIAALKDRLHELDFAPEPAEPQPGMFARIKDWLGGIFKPKAEPQIKSKTWETFDRWEKDAAREIMQKAGPGKLFSGFDPTLIAPLAKYTAAKIGKTGLTLADFTKQIVGRFGDAVKPHTQEIWDQAQLHVWAAKMDATDARVTLKEKTSRNAEINEGFKRKNRPVVMKVLGGAMETNNAVRAIITAYDLSAPFRQGAVLSLTNPHRVPAAAAAMIRGALNKRTYQRAQDNLERRPNARNGMYEKAGLYLADNTKLTKQEEAFLGRWVRKIPGIAASERAFNGYLNRIRADVFDALAATLPRDGMANPVEAKAIGNWVNAASGRGSLPGRADAVMAPLAQGFFSPRYLLSRLQVMGGQPLYGGTWRTRKIIAREYGKGLLSLGILYATTKALLGDEVEITFDPRSADFGKFRFGNQRIDPLAGFSQLTAFGWRMLWGETKNDKGEVRPLRGKGSEGWHTGDVFMQFVRNKLSPGAGVGMDFVIPKYAPKGKGVLQTIGEDNRVGPKSLGGKALRVADKVIPISVNDVYDSIREQGVGKGTALSLLAILGMGSQVYDRKQ